MLYLSTTEYKNFIELIYWYQFEKEQKELELFMKARSSNEVILQKEFQYDKPFRK